VIESVETREKKMFGSRYAFSDDVARTVNEDDMTVTFSGQGVSGRPFSVTVQLSDANEWLNGGLIQNCFPYLSADERELLMTGIDGEMWDEMFGEDE
jgi:hypothetical protein